MYWAAVHHMDMGKTTHCTLLGTSKCEHGELVTGGSSHVIFLHELGNSLIIACEIYDVCCVVCDHQLTGRKSGASPRSTGPARRPSSSMSRMPLDADCAGAGLETAWAGI
jgi:hypothetical protein